MIYKVIFMGLMVHSLGEIPDQKERDYYIYLLDYGWNEPISNALRDNFDQMSYQSSKSNAVIIKGTVGEHFQNEVFSWHHINGLDGEEVLPALLISNNSPAYFRENNNEGAWKHDSLSANNTSDMKLIIIPFKKFCTSSTEVVTLIQSIFEDIRGQKDLSDFSVAQRLDSNCGRALADAVILQPNFYGIGVDLKKLISEFLGKKSA